MKISTIKSIGINTRVFMPMLKGECYNPDKGAYLSIILKNQIFSFCVYGELFAYTFVQCALPPVRKIINWVKQSFATQIFCCYAEYGYLLPFTAMVCGGAVAGYEHPVVGK